LHSEYGIDPYVYIEYREALKFEFLKRSDAVLIPESGDHNRNLRKNSGYLKI
jgi:hypothetical protein